MVCFYHTALRISPVHYTSANETVESFIPELFKRFKNKIPEMCPLTQIQIDDENLKEKRA